MNKILKIQDGIVTIGMRDGSIKECRLDDMNFTPVVGDQVENVNLDTFLSRNPHYYIGLKNKAI